MANVAVPSCAENWQFDSLINWKNLVRILKKLRNQYQFCTFSIDAHK